MSAWRDCLFSNVRRLAALSDEPAEVVVRATFAACRSARENLVELHKRYGDTAFSEKTADMIESGVTGKFLLEVLEVRAGSQSPPSSPPRLPPPPAKPDERAI